MRAQACLKDRSLKQHAGKLEVPYLEIETFSYRGWSGTLSVSLIQRGLSATLGQRIDDESIVENFSHCFKLI